MALHACHDHAMSGGHLAYKHTFDKVCDKFCWPTLHHDVKTWCYDCQAYQRRKPPHRRAKLPTGHLPVDRTFQRFSTDLVEYKTELVSPLGLKYSYALTILDHFTRFAVLVALSYKTFLVIIKQKPRPIVRKATLCRSVCIWPYMPCFGYIAIAQKYWADVLPFIQLAHNTSFSTTTHETPFFLVYERQARLPVDIIFSIRRVGRSTTTEEFAHSTRENLQIAFELSLRNLSERVDKQKANNSKLPPIPEFTPGPKVLVYTPHQSTDGPNPKPIQPW